MSMLNATNVAVLQQRSAQAVDDQMALGEPYSNCRIAPRSFDLLYNAIESSACGDALDQSPVVRVGMNPRETVFLGTILALLRKLAQNEAFGPDVQEFLQTRATQVDNVLTEENRLLLTSKPQFLSVAEQNAVGALRQAIDRLSKPFGEKVDELWGALEKQAQGLYEETQQMGRTIEQRRQAEAEFQKNSTNRKDLMTLRKEFDVRPK